MFSKPFQNMFRECLSSHRLLVGCLLAGGLEDGRAGDKHVNAALGDLLDVVHGHATVDLEADVVALPFKDWDSGFLVWGSEV